jgi:hypothetical protein
MLVTQNEHWSFARNAVDGTVNKLVGNGIANHKYAALLKSPDDVQQPLLQQCPVNSQKLFSFLECADLSALWSLRPVAAWSAGVTNGLRC